MKIQTIKFESVDSTNNVALRRIKNHFAQRIEFLGEGMIFSLDTLKPRNDNNLGFDLWAAMLWIQFLIYMYNNNFFNEERLKKYIIKTGVWLPERQWKQEHRWAHPDKSTREKINYEKEIEQQLMMFIF